MKKPLHGRHAAARHTKSKVGGLGWARFVGPVPPGPNIEPPLEERDGGRKRKREMVTC